MKRLSAVLFSTIVLTAAPGWAQPPKPRVERVQFAKGASSAEIKAQIKGDADVDYVVRAAAGQTLTVTLKATNTRNYFNVLPPGSENVAMFIGDTGGDFKRVLPADGDYAIRVYLVRAAARRNEASTYTLTVSITGAPLAPLPASKDAVVSGTPFHATATIACVPPFASGPASCEAGVVRRGRDGTATVEVRAPGSTLTRRILFVKGSPVASDATGELTFVRKGDLTVVSIAPDERYEIVDAFIIGG